MFLRPPRSRDTPRPPRIRQHRLGALRQGPPVVEHVDPVGEVGHHLHVVLDPDHREAELVPDAQDVAREVLALVAVQAGRRLVEQQHPRRHRERAREPDHLLDAERQGVHRLVPVALELHELDHFLHRAPVLDLGLAHAAQEEAFGENARPHPRVARDEQVLEHRHVREELAVLEGAGDAERGDAVRSRARDVLAREFDPARARTVDAADAVEHRSLARAVRADQREQLAAPAQRTTRPRAPSGRRTRARSPRLRRTRRFSHTSAGSGGTA